MAENDPVLDLNTFAAEFPWESDDQQKGFLSLLKWLRSKPKRLSIPWALLACWNAQKSKETTEWMMVTVGDHVTRLENEIQRLRQEVKELRERVV